MMRLSKRAYWIWFWALWCPLLLAAVIVVNKPFPLWDWVAFVLLVATIAAMVIVGMLCPEEYEY